MRRFVAPISAILVVLGVPYAASAKTAIAPNAVRVTATQAQIRVPWTVDGLGSVDLQYGTSTAYGTTLQVRPTPPLITGSGNDSLMLKGLKPGTTYHMRGHIREPLATVKDVFSRDITFTTATLGESLVGAGLTKDFADGTAIPLLPAPQTPPAAPTLATCDAPSAPVADAPSAMTRVQLHVLANTLATDPACVTVRITTADCTDLHVGAFLGLHAVPTVAGAAAAIAVPRPLGKTNAEFQFVVPKNSQFTLAVSDDGGCGGGYTLNVNAVPFLRPLATTARVTTIATRSATLNGVASARFRTGVAARFDYGLTTTYGKSIPLGALPATSATLKPSKRLTGLAPNRLYHVRLVLTGPFGTLLGADTTFRTLARQKPLAVRTTRVTVKANGNVALKLSCPLTTLTCSGKVALRRATGRRSSLGSKTFTIGGGKTATVTLKLSAANRRLLRRSHALRVAVTLTGRDSDRVGFPTAKRTIRLIWRG